MDKKVELFFEGVEMDYHEAVLDKQISPAARAEVQKQRELHRQGNVKKTKPSAELHTTSPMNKKEKERVEQEIENETREVVVYSVSDRDAITPDALWSLVGGKEKYTLTVIYFSSTKETFYMAMDDKFNDDPYNIRNYMLDNPNNPLNNIPKGHMSTIMRLDAYKNAHRFKDGTPKMYYWIRTHTAMMKIIGSILTSSELRKPFKISRDEVLDLIPSISNINPTLILGRGLIYKAVSSMSFWNKMSPSLAQAITGDISKRNNVKYDTIYIADRNKKRY